jgi:hypothetical protein
LGVSIQVVGSSFDLEGSSDEAGGRASEDLQREFRDGRASSGVVGSPFEVARRSSQVVGSSDEDLGRAGDVPGGLSDGQRRTTEVAGRSV